jgi:hypothetical protein
VPEPAGAGAAVAEAPPPAPEPPPPLLEFFETPAPERREEEAGAASAASRPPLLGVAACLLVAGGLLAASFPAGATLTRPLAALGLLVGTVGAFAAAGAKPARLVLPVGGAIASGALLLAASLSPGLLGPRYEASRQKSDYDPEAVRVVPLKLDRRAGALEIDGFADASRAAVQQGGVRVRVAGASVGPVQLVDAKKRFTKQPLLAIVVQVQHLGEGPTVPFVHWGLAAGRAVPPATATAGGRKLGLPDLGTDLPVGVSHGQELFPGRAVDDLLVFEAPSGPEPVRLELPAEAWGGRGSFRFHIPASMIATPPGAKPR